VVIAIVINNPLVPIGDHRITVTDEDEDCG
jgi:hypothetical protein